MNKEPLFHLACKHEGILAWQIVVKPMLASHAYALSEKGSSRVTSGVVNR